MPIYAKYVKRYEVTDRMFGTIRERFYEQREGNPEAHIISISEFINVAGNQTLVIYYADGEQPSTKSSTPAYRQMML